MTFLRTLLLVLAGLVATAVPASAHVRLLASTPEAGQALAAPPQSIQLTFDESLKNPPAITVTDPNGTQWAMGRPTMDLKTVTVPADAKQGPAGKYTINYRVTGQDNHLITGDVQFDITAAFGQPGASPEGNPAPQQTPVNHESHAQGSTPDSGGVPMWVAILGTIVVIGSGVALIIGIRRRR